MASVSALVSWLSDPKVSALASREHCVVFLGQDILLPQYLCPPQVHRWVPATLILALIKYNPVMNKHPILQPGE